MSTAGAIGAIAGGLGDLFGGILGDTAAHQEARGYANEAAAYATAQTYADQNAIIAREAGNIRLEQADRGIYKALGTQAAGYAGAGLTSGGSAQEVLRSSVAQGALEKAIVSEQTQINVTGYKEQSAQFGGMSLAASSAAAAAKTKGTSSLIGGIFSAITSVIPFLSDRRLKTDIERVGSIGALSLYNYRFLWDEPGMVRVGVMADEVATHAPHALGPVIEGYATVDYDKLGLAHLVGG